MKKVNLKQARFLTLSLLTLAAFNNLNLIQAAPHGTAYLVAGMNAAQREAKAIEVLRNFVTCPLNQVPRWRDFVDEITTLLAGIDEYKALCKSLLEVRDITLVVLKPKIRFALMPHIASLKRIPEDIQKICNAMSSYESLKRVRLN